jgi:predicted DNA-binding ribbon-helix-helix protein
MAGPRNGNGNHVGIAPPDAPVRAEYERDFYSWLMEQARLLREGQWQALDRDNLVEEIESLGREQFNKLASALRVLLLHMLKWDHQPDLRSRSWVVSIANQRIAVEDVLEDNPSLRPRIAEAVARAYRQARILAAKETGLAEDAFPATCPYPFDEVTSREFAK